MDPPPTQPPKPNTRAILTYLTLYLAHTQVGYSTTSISGFQAMHGFIAAYGHLDPISKTGYNMGIRPQQLAASFVNFGAMLGMLASVPMRKYLSRRHGLWFACVVSVIGSGLQLKPSNVAGLYARRCVIGISNGLFLAFAKVYAVESAPANYRTKILRGFALWLCAGSLLGAVTNNFTEKLRSSWAYKIPLTCHITIPAALVVLLLFIPESPGWLVSRGKLDEARGALALLRSFTLPSDVVEKELMDMRIRVELEKEDTHGKIWPYFVIWRREHRTRTILCFALILSNSSSGIWLMLSYGTVMFQLAGVKQAFHASIFDNLANLLGTVFGLHLLSKSSIKRRSMMILGSIVPGLCILGVAVSSTVSHDALWARGVILVLLIAHGFFYFAFSGVVVGPICEEIIREERIRGVMVKFSTGVNHVIAWLIALTMPYFINPRELNWGPKVCYIWAASNVITALIFFFFLPVTKRLAAAPPITTCRRHKLPSKDGK